MLKARLGMLKTQSSKVQAFCLAEAPTFLNAQSTLMKCVWACFEKHKACPVVLLLCLFFVKKYMNLKLIAWSWRKWHGPLIYCSNTIFKAVYYTNNFLFSYQKTWDTNKDITMLVPLVYPFGYVLVDSYTLFDHSYHNYVFL